MVCQRVLGPNAVASRFEETLQIPAQRTGPTAGDVQLATAQARIMRQRTAGRLGGRFAGGESTAVVACHLWIRNHRR